MAQSSFFGRENFPMTYSIGDSLSRYGNKFQNAFLSSGTNTGKTGFNSGLVSYTPNTPPVNATLAAPARTAPIQTQSLAKATPKSTTSLARKGTTSTKAKAASGTLKPPPPLAAATNPQAAVASATGQMPVLGEGVVEYVDANGMPTQYAPVEFDMSAQRGSLDFGDAYTDASGATMNQPSWWSQNKDMIGGIAQGAQAAAGLANAYLGYKNYGIAKDQFNFAKAAANRDVANQAQLINNSIQNSGEVGMSLAGNTMSPEQRMAKQAQLNSMKVSGSPIG